MEDNEIKRIFMVAYKHLLNAWLSKVGTQRNMWVGSTLADFGKFIRTYGDLVNLANQASGKGNLAKELDAISAVAKDLDPSMGKNQMTDAHIEALRKTGK